MTKEERQALREKHQPTGSGWGDCTCGAMCEQVGKDEWAPCDVIKVLDAIEPVSKKRPNLCDNEHPQMRASASKSKKRSNPCNDDTHEPDESVFYTDIGWNYCPRCGEKLEEND